MKKFILIAVLLTVFAGGTLFSAYGQVQNKPAGPAKDAPSITITRLLVGTSVENREPVGVAEKFASSTEKVFCFLETKDIAQDMEVSFVWIYNGKETLKTNMTLKASSKWRTNANKNLYGQKGDWKVEIRNADGNILKDVQFKVE